MSGRTPGGRMPGGRTSGRRQPGVSGLRIALAQLRSGVAPGLLLALLAAITAGLAASGPLQTDRISTEELGAELAALPAAARSLQAAEPDYVGQQFSAEGISSAATWTRISPALEKVRTTAPEIVRRGLGAPRPVMVADARQVAVNGAARAAFLAPTILRDLPTTVRWVSGSAPTRVDRYQVWNDPDRPPTPASTDPVPIGLSQRGAAQLGLHVGDALDLEGIPAVVTGLYVPRDRSDILWAVTPGLDRATVQPSANGPDRLTAAAVLAPDMTDADVMNAATLEVTYPLAAREWSAEEGPHLVAALHDVALQGVLLPTDNGGVTAFLQTQATATAASAVARSAAFSRIQQLASAAPLGVAVAVLGLATFSVLRRRAAALRLAIARGASPRLVRLLAALECLLWGAPAAAIGGGIAIALAPHSQGPPLTTAIACVLLLALAPAVIAAATAVRTSAEDEERADLGARGSRRRRVAEVVLLVVTVAAVAVLLTRGVADAADPLVVLAPLLVAVAVGALVLRVYPLPLRALLAAARRGRGAVGFVAAASAVRRPAVGLVAVLAVTVAVASGVLSTVLLTGVDAATRQSVRDELGAAINVQVIGSGVTVARLEHVPGVGTVAGISRQGPISLSGSTVSLVAANTAALSRLRPDVPAMRALRHGAIPVLVSSDRHPSIGARVSVAGHEGVVVGRIPVDAGFGPVANWVLVDSRFAPRLVRQVTEPVLLLADPSPGADVRAAADRARRLFGASAAVQDTGTLYSQAESVPTIGGLAAILGVGAIAATALALAAIVLSIAGSAPRRLRSLGVLSVLGLTRAQAIVLTVAETVPVLVTALVLGGGLGVGLAALVSATVDLGAFTGGDAAPELVVQPLALVGVLGVVAALAVVVAGIAARPPRGESLTGSLRMGAE